MVGDFALSGSDKEYIITGQSDKLKVGDWTKQGYPFYSGTGIYSTEINIPEKYIDGKLFLQADCGEDVLEISINGNEPVIVPWHPYKVDITGMVKPGSNTITIKVTNTLINILEGVRKESGLLKEPVISHSNIYTLSL